MRHVLAVAASILAICACTVFVPDDSAVTPTLAPTDTQPAETAPATATLRPTPTLMPTATPASNAIATPLPLQTSANGVGRGSTGSGRVGTGSTGGGTGSTGSGNAPVGVREATSIPVPATAAVTTGADAPTVGAGTPTVPPTDRERYTANVPAGRALVVEHAIEYYAGTVVIWVVSPSGAVLWQQAFTEPVDGETVIDTPEAGEHQIVIYTDDFSGTYDIGYRTR